jgi:hypothetical protein
MKYDKFEKITIPLADSNFILNLTLLAKLILYIRSEV